MFSQASSSPQVDPGDDHFHGVAAMFLMPGDDDPVLMGDMVYNFLAREADVAPQNFPNPLGYPPPPENTHAMNRLTNPSRATWDATPWTTTNDSIPAPSPSPSPSQTSSTSEHNRRSPEPSSTPDASPTPEPSCRQANPVFNSVRGKWSCSICDKCFRGRWECRRHIGVVGKRVKCLACGGQLTGRDDSLRRHLRKYCKGDVRNVRFEDAFVDVKE
ncbi:hypothetical protein BJ322DRAFT_560264 [Thelephora terrestris]|uniref:C2H2-type domain-containing protein n=1 Tax=Thelephora terrestris TaxID=56493 RepID=A0A9P6LAY5_9AGAM|nr:hypothetical protein BJ322DRAFT_560264 [Thelephora terrestris]